MRSDPSRSFLRLQTVKRKPRKAIVSAPGLHFGERGQLRQKDGKILGDAADDWLRKHDPKYRSRARRY